MVAPAQEELAAAFPHLEILELVGQGGMGFVFKARQPKLDRFVALKILPQSLAADPAFAERFVREGRVLARLNHPNIVTVHDFGQANGFFYLLMEFVDGVNLRQAMRAGRFTPAQALTIVPNICEALQYAHNEGILHRDIKPENILLDAKGRVKIADFGIAKLIADVQPDLNLTGSGATLGTPHYMAPEQIERPATVDHRADIYSLGVVFYEMLTGELPLGRFAPPSQKSMADPRLDEVVFRTLEKEPSRRPQSAGEVKTQVETISNGPAAPPRIAAARGGSRKWVVAAVLLVLSVPLVLITLAVMYWLAQVRPGEASPKAKGEERFAVAERRERVEQETADATALAQAGLASLITWSPSLRPDEKPDLDAIRREASDLEAQGKYEEALQRRLWYHEYALKYEPSHVGVRVSFALSEWTELAARYPKARRALMEIRDRGVREFDAGGGSFALLMEVSAINAQLGQKDMTYSLFVSIASRDQKLADRCYPVVEDLLVEKGNYALCARFIRDFDERLEQAREMRVRSLEIFGRAPQADQALLRQEAAATFIREAKKLIEILVGVGRKAEAEKIRDKALATLRVPQLESAIADAELKVGRFGSPAPVNDGIAVSGQRPTTNSMRALAERIGKGEQAALDELASVATELYRGINYTNQPGRVSSNLVLMRAAFRELGEQAGRSNAHAFSALQMALSIDSLKAHAVGGIGVAAGAGYEPALEMLLHHRDWNMLLSSTVSALRPAAANNNERAVQFLADVVSNEGQRGLWYMAAEALKPAAAQGNEQAKAALADYEQKKPRPRNQ
jgi:tRNA A-37 threonylcarbamoyl transferase component Bud32